MKLNKVKIGGLINIIDERNSFGIKEFYGLNINKEFMPTYANTEGLDEKRYKVVRNNRFVYSGMQTGRDECIRISLYMEEKPIIVSPAYTTFEIVKKDMILPEYLFMIFLSKEKDRLGWFYSDSSIRSNLDWDRFCTIEIDLPDIEIQQKYVDIYKAMLENQKSYEIGLDDLKLVCDGYIDSKISKDNYHKLGNYIKLNDKKNTNGIYNAKNIMGFNDVGDFIKPMRVFSGDINKFRIISKGDFVYNPRIPTVTYPIALNSSNNSLLVSPAYVTFNITNNKELLEEYLIMILQRETFSRKVLFNTWGSSTPYLRHEDLCDIEIPIPSIEVQRSLAQIYKLYNIRRIMNEKLKNKIKEICPILIKGSIEEARLS